MSEVKWFHTKLKEVLQKNSVTIKSLCEKCDLNYMSTLKVFKGERLIKDACFDKIIESKCFSPEDRDDLKRAYQYRNISKEDRKKAESFVLVLESIYETFLESSYNHNLSCSQLKKKSHFETMGIHINDHIYRNYTRVLKEVYLSGKGNFEIIIFLPEMPSLIRELCHTINALTGCLDERIDFKVQCMVLKAEDGQGSQTDQLVDLSKYIKLLTLSKKIDIKVIDSKEKIKIKYGVYFNDRTLFLSREGKSFIVEYKDYRHLIKGVVSRPNDMFRTFCTYEEFNQYLKNLINSNVYPACDHIGIRSYLSAVSIGDNFNQYNTHLQSNNESSSGSTLNLYLQQEEKVLANKKTLKLQCICESGIEALLKEGVVPDYSLRGEIINDTCRLALIYDALHKMKLGYEIRLLPKDIKYKHPYLGVINFFELHQKNNQLFFARSQSSYESIKKSNIKDQMYGIVIEDPCLVESFELFCKHVISYKTLDSKASVNRIQSLVSKYYDHDTDEAVKALTQKIKSFEL